MEVRERGRPRLRLRAGRPSSCLAARAPVGGAVRVALPARADRSSRSAGTAGRRGGRRCGPAGRGERRLHQPAGRATAPRASVSSATSRDARPRRDADLPERLGHPHVPDPGDEPLVAAAPRRASVAGSPQRATVASIASNSAVREDVRAEPPPHRRARARAPARSRAPPRARRRGGRATAGRRASRRGARPASGPLMRRWLRTTSPPSKRRRRFLPTASTVSSTRPSTRSATPRHLRPRVRRLDLEALADEHLQPPRGAMERIAFGHRRSSTEWPPRPCSQLRSTIVRGPRRGRRRASRLAADRRACLGRRPAEKVRAVTAATSGPSRARARPCTRAAIDDGAPPRPSLALPRQRTAVTPFRRCAYETPSRRSPVERAAPRGAARRRLGLALAEHVGLFPLVGSRRPPPPGPRRAGRPAAPHEPARASRRRPGGTPSSASCSAGSAWTRPAATAAARRGAGRRGSRPRRAAASPRSRRPARRRSARPRAASRRRARTCSTSAASAGRSHSSSGSRSGTSERPPRSTKSAGLAAEQDDVRAGDARGARAGPLRPRQRRAVRLRRVGGGEHERLGSSSSRGRSSRSRSTAPPSANCAPPRPSTK